MLAKITTYRGILVFQLLAQKSIPGEVSTSLDTSDLQGQIVNNTGKNLGVSPEAVLLLESIPQGYDQAADFDWLPGGSQGACLTWFGAPLSLKDPSKVRTSSTWKIREHVRVANDVAPHICNAIDRLLSMQEPSPEMAMSDPN